MTNRVNNVNKELRLGLAATVLWAAAFALGSRSGFTLAALSLASVLVVIAVARAIDVRALLRPRMLDIVIGVVVGAVTV